MRGVNARLAALAIVAAPPIAPAYAVAPDECDKQRAQYPKDWDDVSRETPLFTCSGRGERVQVRIGAVDRAGRTLMSLVSVVREGGKLIPQEGVYRIWLDPDQMRRLREGKYFATVVRSETACWIRGTMDDTALFFMDNAKPRPDGPDAGSFYNKAPRLTVFSNTSFSNTSYRCEPGAEAD